MKISARRALLPVVLLALAGCDSSPAKYYFKYKLPPDDDPVVAGQTPDNTIHCTNQTTYRDLTNPCDKPDDAIEVEKNPPSMQPDGGLPPAQLPPSPWPADEVPIDECPDIPDSFITFDTLRVEIPCTGPGSWERVCTTGGAKSVETRFYASQKKLYRITIRVRGVLEQRIYMGGFAEDLPSRKYVGGSYPNNGWGVWSIHTSSVTKPNYLNNGGDDKEYAIGVDYTTTIEAHGWDKITLFADPLDGTQMRNMAETTKKPIVIPDIPPAPADYKGEFLQVDFISAVELSE